MKYLLLLSIMLCIVTSSIAQNTIRGTVIDQETGAPLSFVSIYNITNKTTTSTTLNGTFEIEGVVQTDSLQITYIGYEKSTVLATENTTINLSPVALSINEVIVTASREQGKRTEAPVAISVISTEQIEDNRPTTIDQVLNQTSGVYMVDLGNEQHTMSIRKPMDYGASYLYLEDGVPIRTSGVFNHNALIEINMANVGRIELIRGPASSLYGSEAIGGAVNFISKKPTVLPSGNVSIQGNTIGYKRIDLGASGTIAKKVGIQFAGYYADQSDGIIAHSDFDKLALSLDLNYYISKKTELVWSNSYVDYYSDMSGSLDSTDFYSKQYTSNQTFTNRQVNAYRSKLAFNHYWNDYSKSTAVAYFRANSIQQNPSYRVADDFKPWIPVGNPNLAHGQLNDNSFNSYGLILQHKQRFDWLNSSLIGGASIDYSPNTYQSNYISIVKNDDGVYESFEQTDSLLADYTAHLINVGAYLQYKIEPTKGFNIVFGLRYDYFNYNFDNALNENDFTSILEGANSFYQFTPNLGITYELSKDAGLYANYGRGFLPPQVSQLYVGTDIPILDPVYYNNFEIGGWVAFAKGNAKFEASVYRMDGQNEIISVLQDDGTSISQNAGKTIHQGIEYSLMAFLGKDFKFRIGGTHSMHRFTDFRVDGVDFSGKKMPQAPEWIANAQLTYKPSYLKGFLFSIEWQHINEYFMDQQNSVSYAGHDVFNLRVGYTWKSISIWGQIINATDELYATTASSSKWGQSYSLGRPQNFVIGLAYKFQHKK